MSLCHCKGKFFNNVIPYPDGQGLTPYRGPYGMDHTYPDYNCNDYFFGFGLMIFKLKGNEGYSKKVEKVKIW